MLPAERSVVNVVLKGTPFQVRWDPRNGPDRARSGVLGFGRGKLENLVAENEVLEVHAGSRSGVKLTSQASS